jgi:hypothetical protein
MYIPKDSIEVCGSLSTLAQRAEKTAKDIYLAVLFVDTREDLAKLLTMRDLSSGFRSILILPNHEDETISLANQLKPCLLDYADGDLGGLAAALGKLFKS